MTKSSMPSAMYWPHLILPCIIAALLFGTEPTVEEVAPVANEREQAPTSQLNIATNRINADTILATARILCDPNLRGRESTSKGGRRAAIYIADEFRRLGLLPGGQAGGYYQLFPLEGAHSMTSSLEVFVGGLTVGDYVRNNHYTPVHLPTKEVELHNVPCTIVGYGISLPAHDIDEYAQLSVTGQLAIAFSGVPWPELATDWRKPQTLAYKAKTACAHGACGLAIVDDPVGWRTEAAAAERLSPLSSNGLEEIPIPILHITRQVLSDLTGMSQTAIAELAGDIRRERRPASTFLRATTVHFRATTAGKPTFGRNVIAVLPGRDDERQREAVVIGAHYDHLGESDDGVYFGANDNAAGVAALLSIARAFAALARPPRRTTIFIAFDAEEIGRRGSWHYVDHPLVPLARTSLMVNLDMIGRNDPQQIFAVATRSNGDLHRLHQELAEEIGLTVTNPRSLRLGLSDHSPFYERAVPTMYLFGGLTEDYHSVNDLPEKLIPEKIVRVATLAFRTALAVAERLELLRFEDATAQEMPPR